MASVFLKEETGKIIKNGLSIFERGENLLQNGITLCTFLKGAWHLQG